MKIREQNNFVPLRYTPDPKKAGKGRVIDRIVQFEAGELSESETIELFQDLVNSGMAWSLQGSYGRIAEQFIRDGIIVQP